MQLRAILNAFYVTLIVVAPVKGLPQEAEPPAGEKVSSETEQGATELPEMTVTASPRDDTSYNVPNASTATKTDTPIMETPVNIQVVPRQVLRDQQVVRFEKALQNVSGVYSLGTFYSSIIRGFTVPDFYVDGVRQQPTFHQTGFRETANIEQIEVLKGPASISTGGWNQAVSSISSPSSRC